MTTDIHDPLTSQDQHYPPCATSSLEILQIITITIIVTIIIPHFITRILDILKPPRSCDTKSKQEIYAVISVIKDQNKILGGQLELLRGGRYNRMLRRCKALNDVFYEKWLKPSLGQPDQSCESSSDDDDTRAAKHKKRLEALKKEPESKILELLHKDLNLTYRITDRKRRSQELGDALIYIITIVDEYNSLQQPDQRSSLPICKILHNLYDPLNKFNFLTESYRSPQYTWDEVACVMLGDKDIFAQFCLRLHNYHTIVYFFKEHHQLIFVDEWLNGLLDRLVEYLPYDFMNELLRSVRDENEQTRMFVAKKNEVGTYVKLYVNRSDDLYRLLSIRDTINGQIALHVNAAAWFFSLLADIYNPRQRDLFIKLLSIRDDHNRTALQLSTSLFPNSMNNFDFSTESIRSKQFNWDELFCAMLGDKHIFAKIFSKLNNNAIVHFFTGYFQLLFINEWSSRLIDEMVKYLSRDNMDKVLTSVRDEIGQTRMFLMTGDEMGTFVELYINHIDALYALLSIRNTNGQTALHVNTRNVTKLLAYIYIPKQRDALIKLTSITDNNNQTALQVCNWSHLRSLIRRVKNNEYITAQDNTNIVIIYTTNNRPGADEEAQSIYRACKTKFNTNNIKLEKDISQDQIIDCITRSANIRSTYGPTTSLIVILLSNGGVGTIDDCDGNPVNLSAVEAAMCPDILDGRPKLMITACCQRGTDINDARLYAPTHDDFCVVMSCASGQSSTRGVFTRKLAERIENSTENTDIIKAVDSISKEMERDEHEQTPIKMSTLKAKYCPTDDWRFY